MGSPDEFRFASIYNSYYRDIYAYCRRRMDPDRVEDAVADVFLVAWRRIDRVPDGRDALLWLFGVAHNVLSHQWRSWSRRRRLEKKLAASGREGQNTPDVLVVVRDETREVLEAAAKLKPTDLEVLRLAVWEELTQAQIAKVLDIEAIAVKQRLHRARRRLTRELNRAELKKSQSPAAQEGGVR